jgi:hypothetical protein
MNFLFHIPKVGPRHDTRGSWGGGGYAIALPVFMSAASGSAALMPVPRAGVDVVQWLPAGDVAANVALLAASKKGLRHRTTKNSVALSPQAKYTD